jgi:hypothetical protein
MINAGQCADCGNRATIRLNVPIDCRWEQSLSPVQKPQAAQLLHTIRRRWISWRGDRSGMVTIKHDYMRKTIPDFVGVRDKLASSSVIEVDPKFVPGTKSMGYALRPDFRRTRIVEYTDAGLRRRVRKAQHENEGLLLPVHRWLRSRLSLLQFDLPRALAIIESVERVPEKRRRRVHTLEDYRLILTELALSLADELTTGIPELGCDEHGRVHTSVSRLPGILRGCLRFGSEPLVGLELKNSQPIFLGLVAEEFSRSKQARHRLLAYRPNPRNPYGRPERRQGEACRAIAC